MQYGVKRREKIVKRMKRCVLRLGTKKRSGKKRSFKFCMKKIISPNKSAVREYMGRRLELGCEMKMEKKCR